MTKKQEWLNDLIAEIPLDTADYDYLVKRILPTLQLRTMQAFRDAVMLARRDGLKSLTPQCELCGEPSGAGGALCPACQATR